LGAIRSPRSLCECPEKPHSFASEKEVPCGFHQKLHQCHMPVEEPPSPPYAYIPTNYNMISCRREATQCFVSLLVSHGRSRSLKMVPFESLGRFPIRILWQLWPYLQPFPRNTRTCRATIAMATARQQRPRLCIATRSNLWQQQAKNHDCRIEINVNRPNLVY